MFHREIKIEELRACFEVSFAFGKTLPMLSKLVLPSAKL